MNDSQFLDLSDKQALDRKVRLKNLIDEVKEIDTSIDEVSTDRALKCIGQLTERSDAIIAEGSVGDRAEHTTEVVLDAELLKRSHAFVSKVLQKNSEFKSQTYTRAIMGLIHKGGDDSKWSNVTNLVCAIARTVRVRPSMLGTFEFEIKEKVVKQRQHRKRTTVGSEKRPDVVKRLQRRDPGAQRVNMAQTQLAEIFKKNNRQPVPYYQLIIDPGNFMNSVENALQIAFLAQSNRVAIETGKDGNPHVRLITSEEIVDNQKTKQAICTLNADLCNKMIKFYKIKQPMLTVRESEDDENEEGTVSDD